MVSLNKNVTTGDKFVTTYYVRDPQGNVLAVYEHKHGDSGNGTFTLTEQHLYGSGRLGMKKRDLALNVANASEPTPVTHYELTNHLGNVMAVISDEASTTDEPTVVSLSDYYPYGMTEPGRSYTRPGDDYRFGYTGHEKENDLAEGVYITEYRLLDTRLGRWLSVDPLAGDFAWMSPYNYCENDPMIFVDPDGEKILIPNGDGKYVDYVPGETKVSDINDEFGKSVVSALNYLYEHRSQKMEEVINELSYHPDLIYVRFCETTHTNGYSEIQWNPNSGFISDNGTLLSPANGLYHEMGHVHLRMELDNAMMGKDIDEIEKAEMRLWGEDWDTWQMKGDEYVIKEYETDAAIQCGEFVSTDECPYTRNSYPGGRESYSENELCPPNIEE